MKQFKIERPKSSLMTIRNPSIDNKVNRDLNNNGYSSSSNSLKGSDVSKTPLFMTELKLLFNLYSCNSQKFITSQKFVKLLQNADLIDHNLDEKKADIIFYKESKNGFIDFDSFCNTLVIIANVKYPNEFAKNNTQVLDKIIENHLIKLLKLILSQNNNVFNNTIMNLDKITKLVDISKMSMIFAKFDELKLLYKKYFISEDTNKNTLNKDNVKQIFISFLKDFEIFPQLISSNKIEEIISELFTDNHKIIYLFVELENIGSYFTYFHFLTCILYLSLIIYTKNNINIISSELESYDGTDRNNLEHISCKFNCLMVI